MITFLDGPAEGFEAAARRAPFMVRVCIWSDGRIRALTSRGEDAPADCDVHVYRQTGDFNAETALIPKPEPRTLPEESYRLLAWQPFAEAIRTADAWQAWCEQHIDELCDEEVCSA